VPCDEGPEPVSSHGDLDRARAIEDRGNVLRFQGPQLLACRWGEVHGDFLLHHQAEKNFFDDVRRGARANSGILENR